MRLLSSPLLFWIGWVILPIIVEFVPAFGNFLILAVKRFRIVATRKELDYLPPISIIIPVYNSAKTLRGCLQSVAESDYDISKIDVICVDNGSKDNSFEIFQECQDKFSKLSMNYMRSEQGKSNALNLAIYNCEGKHIVNIDSDGVLEKKSLRNLARKFENNPDVNVMTGAVLIDPNLLDIELKKPGLFWLKLIQREEFLEYCQAFLAGRNFQAERDEIFTMSGAFSAFRKSTLFKTRMYNSETICEDTQMTFQIKENLKQKVLFCEDSLFFVDPIESVNKLYTQRQRWQIGELEVMQMFVFKKMKNPLNILRDSATRLLVFDHTMAFPKLAWLFILIILSIANRTSKIALISTAIIYGLGLLSSWLFSINARHFLSDFPEIKKAYKKHLPYILLFPLYSYFTYVIRLCGILHSIGRTSSWKTSTFSDETKEIKGVIGADFSFLRKINNTLRRVFENYDTTI